VDTRVKQPLPYLELEKEINSKQFLRCCRVRHLKAALKRYAKFRERDGLEIKIKVKPAKQAA
jgi:hypothetical protein